MIYPIKNHFGKITIFEQERLMADTERSNEWGDNQIDGVINGTIVEKDGNIIYDLRSLDLSRVALSHIHVARSPHSQVPRPFQNSSCGVVTHLLLDYNEIQEIPNEIGDMECLKKLSLMGNQLLYLPDGIGKLRELEILNINENAIQSLLVSLGGLVNLRNLYAIANKISLVEVGIFCNMKKLKELYLDENLLKGLPNDLCDLTNLEILECSENELYSLPDGIGNLHKLSTLNLEVNKLTALPESLSQLKNLKLLLIPSNNIKALPSSFLSASNLEKLILDKNDLRFVPDWFGDLKRIQELSIDDNELCNEAFTEDFCDAACEIIRLSAGRNYLTKLPENIGKLKKLTWLCLGSTMMELERSNFQSGNWLSYLPDSIAELVNLKRLHLDENQIHSLPDDFGHLRKLEWLDLGQNQLEYLPDSFCELTSLTYLQLSKNKLKCLPDDIGNLDKLVELRIDSNLLTEIPESISRMKVLHSLDLFHNCLTVFPRVILSLRHLKRLDVEQNKFPTSNLPKLIKENVYPERDKSLQDNWRGKTRDDKKKCIIIEMPAFDEDNETEDSDENEAGLSERTLIGAMKAGMSLWKHHDEREVLSSSTDEIPYILPNIKKPHNNSQKEISEDSYVLNDSLSQQCEEDWDNELRDELYQDTLDTCSKREDMTSVLIDSFQNKANKYPPCFHAYTPTACYDSLVYAAEEVLNIARRMEGHEEGQFDDADP